ncbi:MAG: hypothetical protein JST81_01435 [Bacteroidetes bacterium]|nr:hypothetical protein [Bacteroidota bacterium]
MKIYVSLVLLFCSFFAGAQSIYPYEEISLKSASDYKSAEPLALNAANYLLTTPFKEKDSDRERAFSFLLRWTAGDKDYHFEITGRILDVMDEKELMSLVIPAMVKFCLENKALGSSPSIIEKNAIQIVLNYCDNPANNFTLKKKLRRKLEN